MPMFLKGNPKITGTVLHDDCQVNYIYNNQQSTFKKLSQDAIKNPVFQGGQSLLASKSPID